MACAKAKCPGPVSISRRALTASSRPSTTASGVAGFGHLHQHPHAEVEAAQCGDGEHLIGGRGQARQAAADDIEDALGQVDIVERTTDRPAAGDLHDDVALHEVSQHLVGEERIARGPLDEGGREGPALIIELITRRGRHQVLDALLIKPAQRQTLNAHRAMDVGEEPAERVRAVDLGISVGAEHAETVVRLCGEQMTQQRDGRRCCPVEIVQHQHHRPVLRSPVQQIGHRVEQPGLLERRLGPNGFGGLDGRHEPADLATVSGHMGLHDCGVETVEPPTQGLGERLVGHGEVFLAATEQHQRALLMGSTSQRRHQTGLAHPRLTGDEYPPTLAGARRLERGAKHLELRVPTDHQLGRRRGQRHREEALAGRRCRRESCTPPPAPRCP